MSDARQVVTGIWINNGRIFLQQRGPNSSYPMLWETPGGKVEKDEPRVKAIGREWMEELKLEILILSFINSREFRVPQVQTDFDFYVYLVEPLNPSDLEAEALGYGWFTPKEAARLTGTPSLPFILELLPELMR